MAKAPYKYRSRTTPQIVAEMRRLYWEGVKCPEIAKRYNLSYPYTWQVCNFYRLRGEPPPDFRPKSKTYSSYNPPALNVPFGPQK